MVALLHYLIPGYNKINSEIGLLIPLKNDNLACFQAPD